MKNIAFVNSMKSWGGGEKWHLDTSVYFMQEGYNVHFFLTEHSRLHKELLSFPEIHLHFIKVSGLSFLNLLKVEKLKKIFKNLNIGVVIISLSPDLKLLGKVASEAGVPRIIYARAVAFPIKDSLLNRYIFSHWVTDILANSNATAKSILLKNQALFPKEKIKVIYNPLDIEEFTGRPYKTIYKRRNDEIIIGSLGRLEKEKNHSFLILLSEYLVQKNVNHTILIGGEGSLEVELKERILIKGLNDHFVFTGFLPNVKDLLMSCDLFMLPSLMEGFGFVMAEAYLCKKPVLAFNTSSIPELVDDGKTGFIIEVNNVEACAEKVTFLHNYPENIPLMGEKGFELVRERFDKKKIMQQMENFVE